MAYCDYYRWTSSFLSINEYCVLKEDNKYYYGDSSVTTEEVDEYCKGYTCYKDCPVYKKWG